MASRRSFARASHPRRSAEAVDRLIRHPARRERSASICRARCGSTQTNDRHERPFQRIATHHRLRRYRWVPDELATSRAVARLLFQRRLSRAHRLRHRRRSRSVRSVSLRISTLRRCARGQLKPGASPLFWRLPWRAGRLRQLISQTSFHSATLVRGSSGRVEGCKSRNLLCHSASPPAERD